MRHQIDQFIVNMINLSPHCPTQLTGCAAGCSGCFRIDQINDRLRLGQIHLSVQKGPAGKLPRLCLPNANGEQGLQRCCEHCRRAVALEFYRILSGITMGCAGIGCQTAVNQSPLGIPQRTVYQRTDRML